MIVREHNRLGDLQRPRYAETRLSVIETTLKGEGASEGVAASLLHMYNWLICVVIICVRCMAHIY